MDQFKVSVIVPVYNVEPYLHKCLDSLVNQTLKDIEIICINDCSPDKSLAILKEYAKKDERVKIIDFKENQGVSAARNIGMKIAKGEYIGFCDPDDYVDLDFYEKLHKLAKSKDADIAKAAIKKVKNGSYIKFFESMNKKILKHKGYFTQSFYTAIYRKTMLKMHKIKFPVGKILGQDLCFSNHAVIASKNVYVLNNTFYNYVERDSSSTTVTYCYKRMASAIKCRSIVLDRLNKMTKIDKTYIDIYIYTYIQFVHDFLYFLEKNSENKSIKKVARTTIDYYPNVSFHKKLNLSKPIATTHLKNKNEKELIFLLKKWVDNGFYPNINIKDSNLQDRKLYIWGAGVDGSKVQMRCERNNWKISAFLDSNKDVKEFNGYKVKRPKYLLSKQNKDFFIIISSIRYAEEIAKICENAGLKMEKDFWRPK